MRQSLTGRKRLKVRKTVEREGVRVEVSSGGISRVSPSDGHPPSSRPPPSIEAVTGRLDVWAIRVVGSPG